MTESYKDRRAPRSSWDLPRKVLGSVLTPRVRGTLRVGAYLSVLCVVAGGLSARSAWGSMSEQALVTGRQLSKLGDFTKSAERLNINGQMINMATATTDLPMDKVLDRFEAICREDGAVARDFREIKGLMDDATLSEQAKRVNYGIMREEKTDDGFIACTVKNPLNGKRSFWDGAKKFAAHWDVAEIGLLRYAYVRKLESGRTHVLTAWTDGSFRLDAMSPPGNGQDAPGIDSANVPRPPDSVRFLSAAAEGSPHGVRIYESKQNAGAVLTDYEQRLGKSGWQRVYVGEDAPEARYFNKGNVDVIIVAQQKGDRAVVSTVETRGF